MMCDILAKMSKSKLTPKEIAKKRISQSKLMKIELSELNYISDKENRVIQLPPIRHLRNIVHEKNVKEFSARNPFDIPDRQRLFSKSKNFRKTMPVPFIMSEPLTICDIDATFYKKIEGRPLRQFDDIKVYMKNIRDITLFRANTAYLKDQIIQIDATLSFEIVEYKKVYRLFEKCKVNFVRFAKESYANAKAIQKKAEEKAGQLDCVTEELEALSFKFVAVRNKLGVINITFETLSKYRQFLNNLSPIPWREKNDPEYIKGVIFEPEQIEPDYSLGKFLVYKDFKPLLFFTKPRQMMQLFDNLSRQCLTYMEIDVFASSMVTSVLKSRDYFKAQAVQEINELEELVTMFKDIVEFMEIKEQEYKTKFERILLNQFQELYASYDVVKLFTCLQFTNTQVFKGPEDPKDSISTLILQLELDYTALTSGLDSLNQEVVKAATNELFSQDLKMMRQAHLAQRNLRECNILSKALFTSFEPPRRRHKQKSEGECQKKK